MSEQFITLVGEMREAQREYFEHHRQSDLQRAQRLEARVDAWIERHVTDLVQLLMWTASSRTDEEPGVYNVASDETKT